MRTFTLLSAGLFIAIVSGCGSTIPVGGSSGGNGTGDGGSGASSGANADKCTAACTPPTTGPCSTQDASACMTKCTAAVESVTAQCAQCLLEQSGYTGKECAKIGAPGDPQYFGPGASIDDSKCAQGATCATCSSACPCTVDKESCDGFQMAHLADSHCGAFCTPPVLPPSTCQKGGSGNSGGGGSCSTSQGWTCGSDTYAMECSCPGRQCKCQKNGSTTKVVTYAYSCSDASNCDASLMALGDCGFPVP